MILLNTGVVVLVRMSVMFSALLFTLALGGDSFVFIVCLGRQTHLLAVVHSAHFCDGLQTSEVAGIFFMSPILALLLQDACACSVVSLSL